MKIVRKWFISTLLLTFIAGFLFPLISPAQTSNFETIRIDLHLYGLGITKPKAKQAAIDSLAKQRQKQANELKGYAITWEKETILYAGTKTNPDRYIYAALQKGVATKNRK